MKKGNRMYVLIVSVVLFVFLLMYPVIAVNMVHVNEMKNSFEHKSLIVPSRISVDLCIHLTKTNLPVLKQAARFIGDSEDKEIIQQIITIVQEKGYVDSNDIQEIAQMLHLNDRSFYSGYLSANGDNGQGFVFPFTLIANLIVNSHIGLDYYAGPILFGSWSAQQGEHHWGRCTINGQIVIDNSSSGEVFGGFGAYGHGGDVGQFFFGGMYVLIIVHE